MYSINYKSDFKLFEEGCDFTVPFLFEYRTVFDRLYLASHVDGIYTNCQLQEDGRLLVVFDDHNLPPGILTCTRHFYLSDQDFHDGICDLWDKRDIGIILTTNRTDCCEVSIELPPFYMQGEAGTTPHIGENGNWYIGDEDTGVLAKGKDGSDGKTPVFVSGTVTTLQPNTSATGSVESDGVSADGNPKYKINLGIPRGEKGESGTDGTNGADGKTPIFESGRATSVDSSAQPSIDITSNGTDTSGNPKYLINVSIPKGQKGDTGEQGSQGEQGGIGPAGTDGTDGKTPVLEIGQTSTLDPGSSATAFLIPDGTDSQGNPKYKLNLGIPKGEKGEEGYVTGGLSELSDVDIASLQDNQILISSSGKWINANLSDYVSTDLDSISDLDNSWKSLLQGVKPTTLSGYGILDSFEESGLYSNGSFDDIVKSGSYQILSESFPSDGPDNTYEYGMLLVFKSGVDHPVTQIYIPHDNSYGINIRQKYEVNDWQSWRTIVDNNNFSGIVNKLGNSTVGATSKPIYLNLGIPTECSYNLSANVNSGSSGRLAYYSGATYIDDYTDTVGSSNTPVYISNGTLTKLSSTVGSSTRPVYLNGGTISQCSYSFGNSNGNIPISNGTLCTNLNSEMLAGRGISSYFTHKGRLSASDNVNNIKDNGAYNLAEYDWPSNGPDTIYRYGTLSVFKGDTNSSIIQMYVPNDINGGVLIREHYDGWSSWRNMLDNNNYNSVINSSDERLKEKIEDINLSIEDIALAPSFRFRWLKTNKLGAGSTAQYWRKILPDLVQEDSKGYLSMEYSHIALLSSISIARKLVNIENEICSIKKFQFYDLQRHLQSQEYPAKHSFDI